MEIPAAYATDAVVLNSDGVPITTSLKVARVLGTQHLVITCIIEELLTKDHAYHSNNYVKVRCTDFNGMVYQGYEMNREGFDLVGLRLSSSGIPWGHFEVFIQAFNALEQKIQNIKIQTRDRGEGGAPAADQVRDDVEPAAEAEGVPESESPADPGHECKTKGEILADLVTINANGIPVTTSLKVARAFKLTHDQVIQMIRDIKTLEGSKPLYFKARFGPRKLFLKFFEITLDGFSYLSMRLNGRENLDSKSSFYKAFEAAKEMLDVAGGQVVPENGPAEELKSTDQEPEALVTINADGIPVTTSLKVAKLSGLEHRGLLRSMRILLGACPDAHSEFTQSSYIAGRNCSYVMYIITREGIKLMLTRSHGAKTRKAYSTLLAAFDEMKPEPPKHQAAATSEPETSSNVRINDVPKDLITLNADGEPRTTSLKLAKLMGREHKDLFFAISKLIKNDLSPDWLNEAYSLNRHSIQYLCRWLPLTDAEDPDVMFSVLRAFDEFKPEVDAPAPIEAGVMADESVDMKTTDGAEATLDQKQIIPFDFKGHGVTVIIHDDGNPWWVAKEVCDILGYEAARNAVAAHCKYPKLLKGTESVRLGFGPRGVNIIPESDLYRLVIKSRLPAAEEFEKWVMEEVLPTIRKTGGYQVPAAKDGELDVLKTGVVQLSDQVKQLTQEFTQLSVYHKTLAQDHARLSELTQKLETEKAGLVEERNQVVGALNKATPKLIQLQEFINSQGMYGLQDAAKIMGLPPNLFIKALRTYKFLMEDNLPYQRYITQGLFRVKSRKSNAGHWSKKRTFITTKGMCRVRDLIDEGIVKVEGYAGKSAGKFQQAPLFRESGGLPRREIDDIFDHFFKQEGQC